jgi:hypothetical protein
MEETMTDTPTRPLRPEELTRYSGLAVRIAALTDDELAEIRLRWHERIRDLMRDAEFRTGDAGALWDEPIGMVEIHMADVLIGESNHRRMALLYAEADMRGGHDVRIGWGDNPKKFNAWCLPYDEMCWEGADRDTLAEAVEDGRRHNPGFEPQLLDWLKEEDDD